MKTKTCKHCNETFDTTEKPAGWMANHSRWCIRNPKRNEYETRLALSRTFITDESRRIASEKISDHHKNGTYDHIDHSTFLGKTHTEESKNKIREKALKSKHRRLRKGVVEYNGVLLDSSWELALAKRLDELKIKWTRPLPLQWVDEDGLSHNYFPDFHLTDYDVYLDPKNPHAVNVQKKKLDIILKQYSNIVIIDTLDKCKNYSIN